MKKLYDTIRSEIIAEQEDLLKTISILTEEDIAQLPPLLANHLRKTGSIGKPITWNADVYWKETELTLKLNTQPKRMTTRQFVSSHPIARIMDMKIHGMPFRGIDIYRNGCGEMQGKILGLFKVIDEQGPIMDISELITLLCEFPLLPSSLFLHEQVQFKQLDDHRVKVVLSDNGNSVSGIFTFNEDGLLSTFETSERFRYNGKETPVKTPFISYIDQYSPMGNILIPTRVRLAWIIEGKEETYFTGTISHINGNMQK